MAKLYYMAMTEPAWAAYQAVFKKLEDIAARGSTATIANLGTIQQELIALESQESPLCDEFEIDVRRLQARVGFVVDADPVAVHERGPVEVTADGHGCAHGADRTCLTPPWPGGDTSRRCQRLRT